MDIYLNRSTATGGLATEPPDWHQNLDGETRRASTYSQQTRGFHRNKKVDDTDRTKSVVWSIVLRRISACEIDIIEWIILEVITNKN